MYFISINSFHFQGKSAGDQQPKGFQISHRFEAHSYMTPTECDLCSQLLYGAVKQGCKGMYIMTALFCSLVLSESLFKPYKKQTKYF